MSRVVRWVLGVSIVLNIVLAYALVAGRKPPSAAGVAAEDLSNLGHLALQLRCGREEPGACETLNALDEAECEKGSAQACTLRGIALQVGRQVPKNEASAREQFRRACELGDGAGCWYLGTTFEYGRGGPVDLPAALPFYEKGCALRHENACLSLARSYEWGRNGVAKDAAKALDGYDRCCALKYKPCCERAEALRGESDGGGGP